MSRFEMLFNNIRSQYIVKIKWLSLFLHQVEVTLVSEWQNVNDISTLSIDIIVTVKVLMLFYAICMYVSNSYINSV